MSAKHSARVLDLELSFTRSLCESIDTPRSLSVALMIKFGAWQELLDLTIDPKHYDSPRLFADDYLVTAILQKNPRLPTGIKTEKKAMEKFEAAEASCKESNDRLSMFQEGRFSPTRDVLSCLTIAQRHISETLGKLTRAKLSYSESKMRFGPGATTSLSGVVTQGKKYSRRTLDVTPRALPFRAFGFPVEWRPFAEEISLRRASKVRVVPKNAKTGRTICIEPDLNIFIQLGQGALLRKCLADVGLDLSTQSTNQQLAKVAWKEDLCTMDLSGASDSICREAVWFLLPFDWADYLHFSRTDMVEIDGKELVLEKWSSMGNGYTFELETLIFYSILTAAAEYLGLSKDHFTAYGDDLIFPNKARSLIQSTLEFLGFSVNSDKTFGEGVFHESCGTDWFKGENVRPIFLRSDFHDYLSVCYLYANSIRRYSHHSDPVSGEEWCDRRMLPSWLRCFTSVPSSFRYFIPDGFGDVGFIENLDKSTPSYQSREKYGWSGWNFRYRKIQPHTSIVSVDGCYLAALNGSGFSFSSGKESLRGRFETAATSVGYTLVWPNLGSWQ